MTIDSIALKIKRNKVVTPKERDYFLTSCKRVTFKVARVCKLQRILYNSPSILEDAIDDIFVFSLTKAIKGWRPSRGRFITYFYYKLWSMTNSKAKFYKRRYKLYNYKYSLDNL